LNKFAPPKRLQGIQRSVIRRILDRAKPGSINLGLGEPDLPTPDVIRRAAVKVIVEEQNGYTSHAGLPALREKVATKSDVRKEIDLLQVEFRNELSIFKREVLAAMRARKVDVLKWMAVLIAGQTAVFTALTLLGH